MEIYLDEIQGELVNIAGELSKIAILKQVEQDFMSREQAQKLLDAIVKNQTTRILTNILTVNELRARDGLEPFDGDEFNSVPAAVLKRKRRSEG